MRLSPFCLDALAVIHAPRSCKAQGGENPRLGQAGSCGVMRAPLLKELKPAEPDGVPDMNDMNSDASYRVTADELRSFIERIERLDAEKKDLAEQQKEVMAEAKSRGYDTKVMRKVIALRKREPDDIAEEEAVLEMYKEALGMS